MTRAALAAGLAALVLPLAACSDAPPAEDGAPLGTVFVGDSITRGVNPESMSPDEAFSWVEYVGSEPGTPWRPDAIMAEFGRTLLDMHAAFGEVLAHDPEAVVIMGGTNDAFRQLPVEPSVEALRSMVTAAQDEGAEVWVVAPPPVDPAYDRDVQVFVDAEAALAAELDVEFVDVRDELTAPDGNWRPGLSVDGVHPSQAGARRIAALVVDELES